MKQSIQMLPPREVERAMSFARNFTERLVYSVKNDAKPIAGSVSTVYNRLHVLQALGLAKFNRDVFEIKPNVVTQPPSVQKKIFPSLIALKNARRFGKYYNESDINFAKKNLPGKILTTLDYAAWELTKFQSPLDFITYVDDVNESADYLINKGFNEGKNGNVILLPKTGDYENMIDRIYLDCIANGGRSTLDAIAIELLYEKQLTVKGHFPISYVKKVSEDLPRNRMIYEQRSK